MPHYIDAIVIPVPRTNLDTYKRMSEEWGNAHLRHGALGMVMLLRSRAICKPVTWWYTRQQTKYGRALRFNLQRRRRHSRRQECSISRQKSRLKSRLRAGLPAPQDQPLCGRVTF